MAAPSVDTRKLKDSAAEYLRKNKFEKAAEALEQLVKAEPKDFTHRLKLGDAYRKMEAIDKAIVCYQAAAKHYSDQGLLIKAIGAVKVILEMDPRNQSAQRELQEMNSQRFPKALSLEPGKPKVPKAGKPSAAAPAPPAEIDLVEVPARAPLAGGDQFDLEALGDEDEPLELDDGHPSSKAGAPAAGPRPPRGATRAPDRPAGPPPKKRGAYDLSGGDDLPEELPTAEELDLDRSPSASRGVELALEDPEEIPELPPEAILEDDQDEAPASPPPSRPPPPAKPRQAKRAPPPPPTPEEVLDLDEPLDLGPARPKASPSASSAGATTSTVEEAHPIADLLDSGEAEEEIELLSISSDEEEAPAPAAAEPLVENTAEIDAAFGAIAEAAAPRPTPRVPLFDDLPQAAFVELVNRLGYRRFSAPELILKEGDPGRSFFVIVEGKVRVFKAQPGGKELTLAHLSEGAFFGEMALLSGAPRTANVAAEEDTEVLEITEQVLSEVVEKFPQVGVALKTFYRQRLLNNVMAISPLFKGFNKADRKLIIQRFLMRQARQGEVLIAEGSTSDGLYIVLHGAVSVVARNRQQKLVSLARLKEGDLFGEMSMLTREPAAATVLARTNSILLRLPRESFQELVLTHPQILELVSALTERRKSATEAILRGQNPGTAFF
jgi:CRP-like cAMP-binding protein/tetratricopeptide (TPR) repeat protein